MSTKRRVEIFSADCPICRGIVAEIEAAACPSCEVVVSDLHQPEVAQRAAGLEVRSVPAVAIDGELASCCAGGPDLGALRRAGLGRPV